MKFRARVVAGAVAVMALGLVAVGPAFAECNSDTALFEDTFEFLDPSWGVESEELSVDAGALVLRPGAGYWRWLPNQADLYQDVMVCADVTIAETANEDYTPVGVIFWFQDYNNFYLFKYWTAGGFAVDRLSKGKWLAPVPYTETLALKKGVGETNEIEIQLKGKTATILANGTKLTQFRGTPPKDGSQIGVAAASPDESSATFKFENFMISE